MAIEHEIVKFVAEMELDAKTTAQFTQGLKDFGVMMPKVVGESTDK